MKILENLVFIFLLFSSSLIGRDKPTNNWVAEALSCSRKGAWLTQDKNEKTVIVEGEIINKDCKLLSSEINLKNVAALFAIAMDQTVIDWTKASRLVRYYIKCRSFFTGKSAKYRRYGIFCEKIKTQMQQNNGDLYYLFTVSEYVDNKKTLLGAIIFDAKKDYDYGTVEIDLLSVKPEAQSRGLSTILAGSIFKFLPQTKRIILDVLSTNKKAFDAYEYFGFARYKKKCNWLMNLIDPEYHYEYVTELPTCKKLQKRTATFSCLEN